MRHDERSLLLHAVNLIPTLKPSEKVRIFQSCETLEDFRKLTRFDMEWICGRALRSSLLTRGFSGSAYLDRAEKVLIQLSGIRQAGWVSLMDRDYPALLREIFDPPFILFFRGTCPGAYSGAVGIVGTRRPTLEAQRRAFRVALELALNSIPVISGLALGIDSSAHEGSVAAHGRTAAVLACGVDRVYPGSNRALAHAILDNGGSLFSEYAPGVQPKRFQFPARNRIISGLCRKNVVVQAPRRSGALHTADFALDQGRDVFVCRESWDQSAGAGTARLHGDGAPVINSADDLYQGGGYNSHPHHLQNRVEEEREPKETRDIIQKMRQELHGQVYRYKGGLYIAR